MHGKFPRQEQSSQRIKGRDYTKIHCRFLDLNSQTTYIFIKQEQFPTTVIRTCQKPIHGTLPIIWWYFELNFINSIQRIFQKIHIYHTLSQVVGSGERSQTVGGNGKDFQDEDDCIIPTASLRDCISTDSGSNDFTINSLHPL